MKKLSRYIAILLLLVSTGCADFLDKHPYEDYEQKDILESVEGLNSLLVGSYDIVKDRYYYGALMYQYEAARGLDFAVRLGSGGSSMLREARYSLSRSANGDGANAWQTIYSLITNLNLIIDNIDNVQGDVGELRRIKGEAMALRGLAYFDLMRLFAYPPTYSIQGKGNYNQELSLGVPIIETSDKSLNPEKYTIRRETAETSYGFIVEQLTTAKNYLHGRKGVKGHVDAPTVSALLMRVYLYLELWDEVVSEGEEWIANYDGNYSMLSYEKYPNDYYEPFNSESIWELEYTASNSLERNSLNYWARKPTHDDPESPDYGTVAKDIGYARMLMQYEGANTGLNILRLYPDDIRQVLICELGIPEKPQYYGFRKYVGKPYHYVHNIPLVRLPEIYLTLAEGYFKTGNTTEAGRYASMVSSVRRLATISGSSVNDIYNERRREFMFEGQNYWDMFRTARNLTGRQIVEYSDDATISFGDVTSTRAHHRAVYPIPLREMNANKAIRDQQNPGYGEWVSGGEEE